MKFSGDGMISTSAEGIRRESYREHPDQSQVEELRIENFPGHSVVLDAKEEFRFGAKNAQRCRFPSSGRRRSGPPGTGRTCGRSFFSEFPSRHSPRHGGSRTPGMMARIASRHLRNGRRPETSNLSDYPDQVGELASIVGSFLHF